MRTGSRRVVWTLSLLALCAVSTRSFAEDLDVAKLLDSAKAAVGEKRYGQALQDLQLAVGAVGRLRMEILKTLLPAAPEGWTAEAAEGTPNAAMLGMGTTVRRSYRKSDEVNASIELIADAPMLLSGLQMALSNPGLVGGNAEVVTVKGRRALLEYRADEKRGTLQILLGGSASLLKVEGNGPGKSELVDVLAGAVDVDAMEKAIQK